jgi:hypothetical protein
VIVNWASDGRLLIISFDRQSHWIERQGTDTDLPPLIEAIQRNALHRSGMTRRAAGFSPDERARHLAGFSERLRNDILTHPWSGIVRMPDGRPKPMQQTLHGYRLPRRCKCNLEKCGIVSVIAQEVLPMGNSKAA